MKPRTLATTILTITLTLITTSLAQAAATLPSILPEGTATKQLSGVSKSGVSTFGTGALTIESPKSTGTFELNNFKLGVFKLEFFEYKNTLLERFCNGLNDVGKTGLILMEGSFHIVDYDSTAGLRTAVTFLLTPVHFECGASTLVILKGCMAGQLTPENVLTKFLTVNLAKPAGSSDNGIITILKEGTPELCQLLASINDGVTFILSSLVTKQTLEKATQGGVEVEVLVMPL